MTKTITKRMKWLIDKARVVTYTKQELELLVTILHGHALNNDFEYNYLDLDDGIKECLQKWEKVSLLREKVPSSVSGYSIDRESDWWFGEETSYYKELNLFQYLLVYHTKVFLFLTCVDRKMVLAYIRKDPLTPFVEWRLRIGK
jgi:hypothetical protein